ncbi:MAG: hypothetical protein COX51_07540 [Syntrophobacteraceae bacterium CG23_combo_of_CG06-09_8_20_14_all_50_8]|nr:MAG: hypothetical protein COX51_07540 [Syntrophobacteraceae bacterium CG23_combo_of_CG06-09_8_20_14_all_50_8]PIU49614.1 MAG: hypothetical protein COS92_05675 [Desulfobacterales bacterium CG07_land_8_20_14_0_80_52_14]
MVDEYEIANRREFKRFPFSPSEEVLGLVSLTDTDHDIHHFKIADIGAGGLRFIVRREDLPTIDYGNTLFLKSINGESRLAFLGPQELEIMWFLDKRIFAYVLIGCRFKKISKDKQNRVDEFIEFKIHQGKKGNT